MVLYPSTLTGDRSYLTEWQMGKSMQTLIRVLSGSGAYTAILDVVAIVGMRKRPTRARSPPALRETRWHPWL